MTSFRDCSARSRTGEFSERMCHLKSTLLFLPCPPLRPKPPLPCPFPKSPLPRSYLILSSLCYRSHSPPRFHCSFTAQSTALPCPALSRSPTFPPLPVILHRHRFSSHFIFSSSISYSSRVSSSFANYYSSSNFCSFTNSIYSSTPSPFLHDIYSVLCL